MTEPATIAAALRPRPIDTAARNGRAQLLSDGEIFVLARWTADGWRHAPAGIPLDIEPTEVLL